MKYLIIAFLIAFTTSVSACKQPEIKSVEVVPTPTIVEETKKPQEPSKTKEPEVKRVCIWVYDAQQKKDVEKCRVTKIFEKREGTPIPK